MYQVGQTHRTQWLKSKHCPFSQEIHRIVIKKLTFKIVLHNRHNNFSALVTPSFYVLVCLIKGTRDKESKKGTMKQMQKLSCTSHERKIKNGRNTEQKMEKI